jgi:hypothetical protein
MYFYPDETIWFIRAIGALILAMVSQGRRVNPHNSLRYARALRMILKHA